MKRLSWLAAIKTAGLCSLLLMLVLLGGCNGSYPYGEFGPNGSHDVRLDVEAPPVIVLHGIKGAKLARVNNPQNDYKSDQVCPSLAGPSDVTKPLKPVWGYTGSSGLESTYERLALYPDPAHLLNDKPWEDRQYYAAMDPLKTIKPDKVLTTFWVGWDVFPVFNFELYGHLVDFLKDEPINMPIGRRLFLFAYDWRLDNRIAAILLANCLTHYENNYLNHHAQHVMGLPDSDSSEKTTKRIEQCRDEARKGSTERAVLPSCRERWDKLKARGAMDSRGNVRFTIVTHSMGGLLARYFADGLGYKDRVRKLILFGSPNLGGMDAMRALLEGEHPPTFWHYLGINWLSAADTTKIHLSFGSLFQLLPRYPKAIVDPQNEHDLTPEFGLSNDDMGAITPQTIARWKDLLSFKGVELDKYKGILDRYLEFQLKSARCFHLAITDQAEPCDDEGQRITQIREYLQRYYPAVATLHLKGKPQANAPQKESPYEPPIINFGGQCDKTLATMAIEKTIANEKEILKKVIFLDQEATKPGEQSRWFATSTYLVGDNRVPVKSFDYPHKSRSGDASFLVCKNHVGIIKDENLLYNLLRAIYY